MFALMCTQPQKKIKHKMFNRFSQMGYGTEEEASNVAYEHYVFLLLPVTVNCVRG